MARTAPVITHPFYKQPEPPVKYGDSESPILDDYGHPRDESFAQGPGGQFVVPAPPNYTAKSDSGSWVRVAESGHIRELYKTCVAYSFIGDGHPMILPLVSRNAWTGFPILATPNGPLSYPFMRAHDASMYPSELEDKFVAISPKYLPLVIHWALNTLSALRFIHAHDIVYGDLDLHENCCLTQNLSLQLVGFMQSAFQDPERGEFHEGRYGEQYVVESDIFYWAVFLYKLLTNKYYTHRQYDGGSGWRDELLPQLEVPGYTDMSDVVGNVVKKCFASEYKTADEVWTEFVAVLQKGGYEVEDSGLGLKSFDPSSVDGYRFMYQMTCRSLNRHLINNDGSFCWITYGIGFPGNFLASARKVRLLNDGRVLEAELRDVKGKWRSARIELDERVGKFSLDDVNETFPPESGITVEQSKQASIFDSAIMVDTTTILEPATFTSAPKKGCVIL